MIESDIARSGSSDEEVAPYVEFVAIDEQRVGQVMLDNSVPV